MTDDVLFTYLTEKPELYNYLLLGCIALILTLTILKVMLSSFNKPFSRRLAVPLVIIISAFSFFAYFKASNSYAELSRVVSEGEQIGSVEGSLKIYQESYKGESVTVISDQEKSIKLFYPGRFKPFKGCFDTNLLSFLKDRDTTYLRFDHVYVEGAGPTIHAEGHTEQLGQYCIFKIRKVKRLAN